ncbi:MAG TPA: type II secretion system F family protein [Burkholderiales bacterium]|nr:type II secretion system F family protein [Burkholderiales bacterium]
MPQFAYTGRDERGQLVQGELEGASSSVVAGALISQGVTPIEITIAATAASDEAQPGLLERLTEKKFGPTDVLLFSRQMNTLLKAGVPMMSALKGLEGTGENQTLARMMRDLREGLEAGHDLSTCLTRYPKVFDAFYVSMVRVGEFTGTLQEIFLRLFHHLEFEKFMRDQVRSAIRYPMFVIITMAVAIMVINVFVIPAFAKAYAGFKTELPLITKGLIGFSNFTVTYWPMLLGLLIALAFGFRFYVNTGRGRLVWDEIKLKIPIAGPIIVNATLARFARSFALAVRSGVPAVQALTIVAATVDNAHMGRRIEGMREGVERGESLRRTAAAAGIFTPMVLQMLTVGEETGELDSMMSEIAELYQRDVEYSLKNLASQIEPILIVGLGVLVLLLALGVFLPIWDLGSAALGKK